MRVSLAGVVLVLGCAVGGTKDPAVITGATIASSATAGSEDDGEGSSESGSTGASGGSSGSGSSGVDGSGDDGSDGVVAGCGDAVIEAPETCDDANELVCDGCEACYALWGVRFPGVRGNALQIVDAAGTPLQLLDTPLTVEAWVRIEAGERVDIMRRSPTNVGWGIRVDEDTLSGVVFGRFGHNVPGLNLTGAWHHVAWTYDQSSSRLFLDGALLGIVAHDEAMAPSEGPTTIGQWENGDDIVFEWWGSRVDEVHISSTSRYEASFTPARRFEPDGDTVWLAHMDEGEGVSVGDASAYGHVATLTGASWLPDDGYDTFCN